MSEDSRQRALVIGASGGIGAAVSGELRARGWAVTGLSRRDDGFDVTDPDAVQTALAQSGGPFDLVFVALGILAPEGGAPEKSLSAITAAQMQQVFAVNTFGPALILRHAADLLPRDRRGVMAVLSARVGSIGDNTIGGWYSYRASKAALNQIVHGAAIELGRSHKQSICVALHPGTVATPFTADYAGRHKTVPAEQAARNLLDVIMGLTPDRTGGFFDYAGKEIVW
ncbi:SDR family NAD(P)-dependent oxidoreductase [Yoonia sp.]|uniref:SDR family NAD(P)-dependent oxidoreductase n=1 Tax=Yoonia sp. TaxID=2212373 RepID=UPI002FD87F27